MNDSFNPTAPLPPLKAGLEAIQIEHEGKPMIMLRDQEGLGLEPVAVTLPAFLIATLLDGRTTPSQIFQLFSQSTGAVLKPEELKAIIDQFDKAWLLETPKLQERRRKVLDDFLSDPTRKAIHAGSGYPTNTMDLAAFLGPLFKNGKGPGKEFASAPTKASPARALIAPHIDLHRGGPAYAWAYQALSETPPPDVILALGVAHMNPNSPWVMTRKSYETPYGPMAVDAGLYDELKGCLWYDPAEDEWAHRTEHSLEFQALWLKYLWRDKTPPWVPVLCSSFDRFCTDRPPSAISTIEEAIQKMGDVITAEEKKGRRVLILAGVDLAHVGPRFGDELKLGPELEKKVEEEDRRSLEHAFNLRADDFYMSVVADDHWRKVCGLSAIYTAIRFIQKANGSSPMNGTMLTYGQAPDPMGGLVSFAGGIF